jgi:hypothetical protein
MLQHLARLHQLCQLLALQARFPRPVLSRTTH